MKSLFLIIGAPGSGKTTDASMIARMNQSIEHYSTGDLLRAEVASGSALGRQIDSFISGGNLVPLDVVVNVIIGAIKSSPKDLIIIDGYPRSVEQMSKLDEVLQGDEDVVLSAVIEVCVSEEVAKERVLGRARGADDNEEVFKNRMAVFLEPIEDIRKFYGDAGVFYSVNGERTVEEIVADINAIIAAQIEKLG